MQNIFLVGDSLTQMGYACGWASIVADKFVRSAQVHNAGLSGYNTRWVLQALRGETLVPGVPPVPYPSTPQGSVLFVTVFLGANDAATEDTAQYVPLAEYKSNLVEIVLHLLRTLRPTYGVVVITPPPVDGEGWRQTAERKYGPCPKPNRFTQRTREYRNAAIEVAKEIPDCICLDTFVELMGAENAETQNDTDEIRHGWMEMFEDGLHFNVEGGRRVGEGLLRVLKSKGLSGEDMPFAIPPFLDIVASHK